jgi:YHS domain-containing protein
VVLITWIIRIVLFLIVLRLVLRFVKGLLQGLAGDQGPRASMGSNQPARGSPVPLVKDPVCGTYVVAGRAISLSADGTTHYFCSEACRTRFERERTATRSA